MQFNTDYMNEKINLELRTEILGMALRLEEYVSRLILAYLNIQTENRKAITHKSNNISFKNRIDLLYDLGILSKEENELFLLMMEFINQFLHNINCSTFTFAVELLGSDKAKKLLKYDDSSFKSNLEFHYQNSYRKLFLVCLEVILKKLELRERAIEENKNALLAPHEYSIHLIDKFIDLYIKICKDYFPVASDSPEVEKIKLNLLKTVTSEIDKIDSTDEFKQVRDKFNNSLNAERIKKYLRAV